jgi:hypothetical protein
MFWPNFDFLKVVCGIDSFVKYFATFMAIIVAL